MRSIAISIDQLTASIQPPKGSKQIMAFSILDHLSFLAPSGKSKSKYICPICNGSNLDVSADGKYDCFSGECDTKAIASAVMTLAGFPPENPSSRSAKKITEYLYPGRVGKPLAKAVRTDTLDQGGSSTKKFSQAIFSNGEWCWKPSTLPELKKQIPIYRYAEVQEAIEQGQQIFIVEGEKTADALWSIGIPATTTIGGSGGYKSYGQYGQDLTGARLILCPDRDQPGLKYIGNFDRDFNSQVDGYCLAGEVEGWSNPSDSRDLADDIAERGFNKKAILASIITVEMWNGIQFSGKPESKSEAKIEPEKEDKGTVAERVLKLAFTADYFCTPDKATYADIRLDGFRETHSIRSRAFRLWLTNLFFEAEGKPINSNAMAEVLLVLDAKAFRSKAVREVNLRTAEHDGKIYLDLGSPNWSAVEIDAQGWRIIAEPPIRFTRPESLLALPTPIEGGSLDELKELKELINVDGDSWVLIITFLLFSLCPNKTYPVLVLSAVRGSGKTAAAEILKGLIDPGKGGLIKLQNDIRNLAAAAVNRWLMVYDNVGYISPDQSDDLCRMATNFGFSTRTLHTTAEETTLEFTRPQIITAIDALVTRDDLADRVLMAQLGEITEDKRLAQGELTAKVEAARPRILGAMLTALSKTLAELPNTKPDRLPRMADYALFSIAAEKALGLKSGEFLQVFTRSREQSRQVVIESSPIGEAIMALMAKQENAVRCRGSASELLNALEANSDKATVQSRYWPKSPSIFSRQLNRLKPDLKAIGLVIAEDRTKSERKINVEHCIKVSSPPSPEPKDIPSKSSSGDGNGDGNATIPITDGDGTLAGDGSVPAGKRDGVTPQTLLQQEFLPKGDGGDGIFVQPPDKEEPGSEIIFDEV
jgi:hypothetical protein